MSSPEAAAWPWAPAFWSEDFFAHAANAKGRQREEAVAKAACVAAVKAHDRLTLDEIEALMVALAKTELPYTCPHGRPTLVHMSFREINRKFGRG